MRISFKTALAALVVAGGAAIAAPASAQSFGLGIGPNGGLTFSYDSGGYCDDYGCPNDFWNMPVYYGPVFWGGYWYDGPLYYRVWRGQRQYWIRGAWRFEDWRGPRPGWWRPGRIGPALGMDYYRSHGFHGRWDNDRRDFNNRGFGNRGDYRNDGRFDNRNDNRGFNNGSGFNNRPGDFNRGTDGRNDGRNDSRIDGRNDGRFNSLNQRDTIAPQPQAQPQQRMFQQQPDGSDTVRGQALQRNRERDEARRQGLATPQAPAPQVAPQVQAQPQPAPQPDGNRGGRRDRGRDRDGN